MNLCKLLTIALAALTFVAVLPGCTLTRAAYVSVHSPENLPKFSKSLPVYAEKGAESIASAILAALPVSIQQIETTHGGKLGSLPAIVVCASAACYQQYAAIPITAAETLRDKRISLNGAKILELKRDVVQLFTHELSHFFWFSRGIVFQPRWFEEGLAVWVSNGGGAESVSVQAAEQAIRTGTTIRPTLNSGLWNYLVHPPLPPENNWAMYYRQAGMFVHYLHAKDTNAFIHLLEALKNTKDLEKAWPIAYKQSPDELWSEFVKEIKDKNTEQDLQKN